MSHLKSSTQPLTKGPAAIQPVQNLNIDRSPTYREVAYTMIKDAILAGQLEPGQPLIEEKLAGLLKISRTPVREALAILEHEGLLTSFYKRGLYVHSVTRAEFIALFVANEAVEPAMARRAAISATNQQLAEMRAAIAMGVDCAERGDSAGFLRSGRTFHGLVGNASGNPPLARFVERNEERVDLYLMNYGKLLGSAEMQASNREHAAIFEAIGQRDPDGAARLTVYHAQSTRDRWAELFAETAEREDT
jgi:DNA-binding GntR family transcriptional regulator